MYHSSSSMPLFLALAQLLHHSHGTTIVLDDMDKASVAGSNNAHEGSFQPCMKDAYAGRYHHDGAGNKGNAHLAFEFEPPKDGCYMIEEYHPGRDAACSWYLPSNARLDVDFCEGLKKTFYVDQATRGGQWNKIGSLPFFQGHKGRLTMRNSPVEKCDASQCFWIADAFRLTWTGPKCGAMEGVLTLLAKASNSNELLKELEANRGVLQMVLQAHLGYSSVAVRAIVIKDRRLQGSSVAGGSHSVEVSFSAGGSKLAAGGGDLTQRLQAAFSEAGAGVTFEAANVEWGPTQPFIVKTEKDESLPAYVIAAVAAAVCVLLGAMACGTSFYMYKKMKQRRKVSENGNKVSENGSRDIADLESAPTKVAESKANEKDDEAEIRSVSTGPPSSEEGCRSDAKESVGSIPSQSAEQSTVI